MTRSFATSLVIAAVLASGAASGALAQAKQPTAAGLWEHADDAGRPDAWFRIAEKNGVFEGQIVKMFPKSGEDPASFRCTKCEGERKDAPVLGITFITGMQRKGLDYENGSILDPRDGSVYSALMALSPDGGKLTVRGYLGFSLLGKSQVWNRLPDTALAPEAPAGGAKPAAPARRSQERGGTTGTAPPALPAPAR
jgi:uncharacterized protein (DUF2147 family)